MEFMVCNNFRSCQQNTCSYSVTLGTDKTWLNIIHASHNQTTYQYFWAHNTNILVNEMTQGVLNDAH